MRISDWSSDVCSSDLDLVGARLDRRRHFGLHNGIEGDRRLAWTAAAGPCRFSPSDIQLGDSPFSLFPLRLALCDIHHSPVSCPTSRLSRRRYRRRSEEHTSELQSLMRISYAVFCLK